MMSKTVSFCDMALELEDEVCNGSNGNDGNDNVSGDEDGDGDGDKDDGSAYFPKVYFRRGRARIFMGLYDESRSDLEMALSLLLLQNQKQKQKQQKDTDIDLDTDIDIAIDGHDKLILAVQKEMRRLDMMIIKAKKNLKRQEKAMKMVLNVQTTKTKGTTAKDDTCSARDKSEDEHEHEHDSLNKEKSTELSSSSAEVSHDDENDNVDDNDNGNATASATASGKFDNEWENDLDQGLYKDVNQRQKEYSTLRADFGRQQQRQRQRRKRQVPAISNRGNGNGNSNAAKANVYIVWYAQMAERSLRKILYWLGDKDAMTKSFQEDTNNTDANGNDDANQKGKTSRERGKNRRFQQDRVSVAGSESESEMMSNEKKMV
uniref:Uncharacterized protein n=1 Tax=Chaetoceros debilis TaxID=122233 RepID=A0A7S3V7N1_9STRA